jgi:hypothetical protein
MMDFSSTARLGAENFLYEESGYESESSVISVTPLPEGDGSEFEVQVVVDNGPLRLVVRVCQRPIDPYVLITSDKGDYWQSLLRDLKEVR